MLRRFQSAVKMTVKVMPVILVVLILMVTLERVPAMKRRGRYRQKAVQDNSNDNSELLKFKSESDDFEAEDFENDHSESDRTTDDRDSGEEDTKRKNNKNKDSRPKNDKNRKKDEGSTIPCLIDGDRVISCRKGARGEIFMPWSFIKDFFEVSGEEEANGTFVFQTSYETPDSIPTAYKPGDAFMNFAEFDVGYRARVKLITATEGVPLTSQWCGTGYHYPTQVAQYGLSHHAKYLAKGEPKLILLVSGETGTPGEWTLPTKDASSSIRLTQDFQTGAMVLNFKTSDVLTEPGMFIKAPTNNMTALSAYLKFATNGSLSVLLRTTKGEKYKIHYILSDTLLETKEDMTQMYYGMGTQKLGQWTLLARDLQLDLMKGMKVYVDNRWKIMHNYTIEEILEIRMHGSGMMSKLSIQSHVHKDQFFYSADWLLRHQDSKGGWPIPCVRRLSGHADIQPGWYSAMGQGQAISALVRAYLMTGDKQYMAVAAMALFPFDVDSNKGGVRAVFFNKYVWYEEYPTNPSSFVLNGFIYSLLGVYDLKETAQDRDKVNAERIYKTGLASLKAMVNMYDTGIGTVYDLRHIIVGIEPYRARWDYHTTHIELLLQMQVIDGDPLFKKTCDRWIGYLKGIRSSHN